MTERRKGIGGRRFTVKEPVQFSPAPKTICTICKTNEVEDYPMMRGVCYDCYRGVVTENVEVAHVDPALERLNRTAGYDIASVIVTKSDARKAWEAEYLAKRANPRPLYE